MDWREYNHAALHRLWQALLEDAKMMVEADAWLAKYGRPPADPLRVELQSARCHVVDLAERVREAARDFAPCRPSVNPWIKQGLAAKLRPDFKARGITNRTD